MRKLRALKEELARANALESHVEQEKDQKRRDLNALRNDPAYLELVARDRLDLYREGEQVYRIEEK
jgi:cell division protein FtsB